jgi:hypothetical protein
MWCMAPPVASHYVQGMTGSPSDMMLLSGPIQRTQRRPGAVSQKRCDRGDSPASLSPSGRLAQLARASRLHREGRGFKSLNAHQMIITQTTDLVQVGGLLFGSGDCSGQFLF